MKKKGNAIQISNFFSDFLGEQLNNPEADVLEKLIIYLILNDTEQVKIHIRAALDLGYLIRSSRWGALSDDHRKSQDNLVFTGQLQINHAIYLHLVHEKSEKPHQLFEWAVENCTLPDDFIHGRINIKCHNEVAVPHLWHGYALVGLERYEEALPFLIQVEPLFTDYKKTGGEIYQKIEFNLPKALIPLCEFKLNPTRQNLINTQKGIEEYIKSLREPRFKLWGYLYYFHLKEQFADVYAADPKEYPEEAQFPAKEKMKEIPPTGSAEPQTVCIWDVVSILVGDEIGTDVGLKDYVLDVTRRGEFPVLSTLYDLYLQWDEFDAAELAEETRRLLALKDLDPEIRKKTEILKEIAEYSAAKGSGRLVLKPEEGE